MPICEEFQNKPVIDNISDRTTLDINNNILLSANFVSVYTLVNSNIQRYRKLHNLVKCNKKVDIFSAI